MAPKRDVSFLENEYAKSNPLLTAPLSKAMTGWNSRDGYTYALNREQGSPYLYNMDLSGKDPRGWRNQETKLWKSLNPEERARGMEQSGKDFERYSSKGDAPIHALWRGNSGENPNGGWLSIPRVGGVGSMRVDGEDFFNREFAPVGSVLQHEYTHGQDNRYLSRRKLVDEESPLRYAIPETPAVLSGTGNTLRALHAARPGILDGVKIGPGYSKQYDANFLRQQAGRYLYGEDGQGRQVRPPGNMIDIMGRPETQQWIRSFRDAAPPPVLRDLAEQDAAEEADRQESIEWGLPAKPKRLLPLSGERYPGEGKRQRREGDYQLSDLLDREPPRAHNPGALAGRMMLPRPLGLPLQR